MRHRQGDGAIATTNVEQRVGAAARCDEIPQRLLHAADPWQVNGPVVVSGQSAAEVATEREHGPALTERGQRVT